MACGGWMSQKNLTCKKTVHFYLLHLIFSYYYCSIDLKRQLVHSRPRPGTSSLVCFCILIITSLNLKNTGCYCNVGYHIDQGNYSTSHFRHWKDTYSKKQRMVQKNSCPGARNLGLPVFIESGVFGFWDSQKKLDANGISWWLFVKSGTFLYHLIQNNMSSVRWLDWIE